MILRRLYSTLPPPTDPGSHWRASRLMWLATGKFTAPPTGPQGDRMLAHASEVVRSARALRAERDSLSRPIRIRESNVLAALREPNRLLEFNRPLPLPSLIRLLCILWDEGLLAAEAARKGGAPPPPRQ